jgi:predicted GIY-YIG superfamily endonuclease
MRPAYDLDRNGGRMREAACVAYVYLLRCADGSLYCGWTTDPKRRLRQHQAALREEARIKRLSRAEKLALLKDPRSTS